MTRLSISLLRAVREDCVRARAYPPAARSAASRNPESARPQLVFGGSDGTAPSGHRALRYVRAAGAVSLLLATAALLHLHAIATTGAPHEATPLELLYALLSVAGGIGGALLLVIGPALFLPCAWPPPERGGRAPR